MNIPIYRAKKIDSDEWVEGYLYGDTIDYQKGSEQSQDKYEVKEEEFYIMDSTQFDNDLIDPNTLAIHFPNMIDKNGKKIFGSLNYDDYGLGGDILYRGENTKKFPLYFNAKEPIAYYDEWEDYEIIGIHKGAES